MSCNALGLLPCSFPPSILRYELTSSPSELTTIFSINPSETRRLAVSRHHCPTFTTCRVRGAMEDHHHHHQNVEDETVNLKHFIEHAKDLVRSDSSTTAPSPYWFTPLDCGPPLDNSPLLLFFPGIDGTGLGLIKHHKKLGKIFEVFCLHIPHKDRTPFTGLVKLVESTIQSEHHRSPNRPIYLVGESLGACLALSVAAFNPDIDLVLILANPATSFSRSQLQPILYLLQFMPDSTNLISLLHILSSTTGATMANLEKGFEWLSPGLVAPSMAYLSVIADILPIETLLWKLQMIKSASSYANSRLHAVKAHTLILSSGRDPLLPSQEEGLRLRRLLANCEIYTFEDCSHFLFLDDALDLVSVIKQVCVYRRSKERDFVLDYIPPSPSEINILRDNNRWINILSPVIFSTLADGKIVRGFDGIPSEGPVVYVGYHMLLGFDTVPLVAQFWDQKGIHLRGIAHPMIFLKLKQGVLANFPFSNEIRLMGAVPVSGKNFFRLLATKSHILLYPGGVREALHRKGEAYKLFWPELSEFVRMAARFGAKIVPFGAVGEDDFFHLLLDYDDQMKIPVLKNFIDELSDEAGTLRATVDGEVGNQDIHLPGVVPKTPGRLYYHFGKPIETEGMKEELLDREKAHELYVQVKSEVENSIAYLQTKRERDPYRGLVSRLLFQARHGFTSEVPAFDLD
uniref:acyltransferase-like protein At3g26840, chloroplastic isoform X2 n=1 Tax=Fragaria vesca subsp. vesca TaxID=101020 RepID=UPI0005C80D40|nr:PREDICTED: acyltransferase-like protein At3g26840, chloroplastic isoform X2 [Fragaria vesca subsp. vesca]